MKRSTTLLLYACLCAAGSTSAAEWSAAPVLSWSVDHDTNRLLVEDEQAGQGGTLQLDLLLKRATGTSTFSLRPHLGWQQFTDNTARNTNNQSLQAAGAWLSDRSAVNAQVVVARDNSLNSELPDTGLLTGSSQRRSKVAALSYSHEQSDRSQLDVQFSYSDIEYEDERFYSFFGAQFPFVSLYGYQYPSVSVSQSHRWSPNSSVQLNMYAARLITDSNAGDSDSYGARLGMDRALTSRINLHFSAGLSRQVVAGGNESGYIGRFELTRIDAVGRWRLHAERSISASGYGALVSRDDAGLSFDRRLAPHWNGNFSLRSVRNDDIGDTASGGRRNYERVEAGLAWQATRTWRIGAATAFTRAQQAENTPMVRGWRAMMSATWVPQPRLVSR